MWGIVIVSIPIYTSRRFESDRNEPMMRREPLKTPMKETSRSERLMQDLQTSLVLKIL